MEEALVNFIV